MLLKKNSEDQISFPAQNVHFSRGRVRRNNVEASTANMNRISTAIGQKSRYKRKKEREDFYSLA